MCSTATRRRRDVHRRELGDGRHSSRLSRDGGRRVGRDRFSAAVVSLSLLRRRIERRAAVPTAPRAAHAVKHWTSARSVSSQRWRGSQASKGRTGARARFAREREGDRAAGGNHFFEEHDEGGDEDHAADAGELKDPVYARRVSVCRVRDGVGLARRDARVDHERCGCHAGGCGDAVRLTCAATTG